MRLRREYVAAGLNFAFETTLTGITELQIMQSARDAGYKINLVFVCLENWQESAGRVATRVKKGGHDVTPEAVERRYARSLENLEQGDLLADRTIIFDNTKARQQLLPVREDEEIRRYGTLPT